MAPVERRKVNPRAVFFAGKAAPGCECLYVFLFAQRLVVVLADYIAKLVRCTRYVDGDVVLRFAWGRPFDLS
jgi:hypothetical protein